ncbi:alpha/beta fold hydrolase [Amycolatopsis thermoflava]|uniref:alpha/beta fold hydrolase n=1 Tax=Amycolatopsis thermoflava TaxID=84480 RepID=UPI0004260B72|nr:alpha/beta hydrolase [Amycolatopsis thermoflava]
MITHQFIGAAGTRIHAEVTGPARAPEVVCVHGLGCSHRYFRPLARTLGERLRVSAPDLPGFGRTPGPRQALDVRGLSTALAEWLRETGRGGSVLVANSAGCQIVVDLAVHAPELLGPVVLIGPSTDRTAPSLVRQLGRLVADAPRERPSLLVVLAWDYLVCGPRRLVATARHLRDDPVEAKLPHVTTPAVVVRGSRDPIASRAWARQMAARLPAGRYVEVPGHAHALNHSAPVEVAALVESLVGSAPG